MTTDIGIIGAGAWGTALAQVFAEGGRSVALWAREPEVVAAVNGKNENSVFLPGVRLNKNIRATEDLSAAAGGGIVLLVTPAQHVRAALSAIKNDLPKGKPVVLCAKGIEIETGLLMSQVAEQAVPGISTAILTGPTFASEIARGLPAAVTVAAAQMKAAQALCEKLATKNFRPYASADLAGAQVGGAVKNVIAIAGGIVAGRGLGESARAALIARGLAEMARLSEALGGRRETLLGLSGVGDLVLTASSMQSRNYSLGGLLGQGKNLADILKERNSVAEGVTTAQAIAGMAGRLDIDMPLSVAVHQCLNGDLAIDDAIARMMERPLRREHA